MAQTLIVRLPALATAETEWVAIDSTGAPIAVPNFVNVTVPEVVENTVGMPESSSVICGVV